MKTRGRLFAYLACMAILAALVILPQLSPRTEAQARASKPGRAPAANFDIRRDKSPRLQELVEDHRRAQPSAYDPAVLSSGMAAAEEKLAWDYPGSTVEINDVTGGPAIVDVHRGNPPEHGAPGATNETRVRDFLSRYSALYGLTERQIAELEKTSDYANPAGNLSWVSFRQEIDGIPVFGGELRAALTPDGKMVRTVSGLAPGVPERSTEGASREALAARLAVSAADAVSIAASSIGITIAPSALRVRASSPDATTVVFEPGPFTHPVQVELVYFPLEAGVVRPAWSMVLWQDVPAYYSIVDGEADVLLWRKNITNDQTQPATYVTYNNDSPAPLSPSNAFPGSGIQGAAIPRTTFTLISEGAGFDNLGWIPDGGNTTTGNNVDAGLDIAAPDGIDPAGRPTGSPSRVFDFSYNPAPGIPPPGEAPTLANYRFGVVTDLFFWSNRYHDRLYELGFTEAAGNFQGDNFGRGGLGGDFVPAQAQDFASVNNANFATPPDGSLPRMQMFIFPGPNPDRDGDLDHDIVIHELTHGTSNRLHANASGLNTAHSAGMGEGWSDFYARALLATPDEDVNGIYPAGAYATLQLDVLGTDNYYYGIRRFPYAVKTTVGANGRPHNPLTFADIDPGQLNTGDGAFPETPLNFSFNGATEVHNIGEVWCMALLEVRARIITRMGFATGNQRALQIVTDGMKLDPADPNLLQGRDSILTADCAGFAGADELDIWAGFAARGMGYSASHNPGASVTEAFDVPTLQIGAVTISNDSCEGGDGFADPGESLTLNIPLTNPFCATSAAGVTVSVDGGSAVSYGTIAAGATVTRAIPFTVPADAPCGTVLTVPVNILSSLGPSATSVDIQIGRPVVLLTATYSSGNIATAIPDQGTVEIPIDVPDTGLVSDVNVRVRLNHSFDEDLVMNLIGPDGTTVLLASSRGGAGDNYGSGTNDCTGNPTIFDDSAPTPIGSGSSPFVGVFTPETPLSAFNLKATNGTWRLRISDTATLDTGTVGCVQLEMTRQRNACCGVPGFSEIQAVPPATLTAESCTPGNGAPDPDETVTMSFPLRNIGTGATTNLVATLLPGGGILAPGGPQNYGALAPGGPAISRPFTFTAAGLCGGNLTATLALQDGATNLGTVTFTIRLGTAVSATSTFTNPASVTIPATGTGATTGSPAGPYPSTIAVSGVMGTVSKVTVTLTNLNHTFPADVDVLLVGPGGQRLLLMSDVGGGTDAVNATLTLDDTAPAFGATVVSGTFRPTNVGAGDLFPAPAPAGPYPDPQMLALFNGLNPNGTWSLFVVDDAGSDIGTLSGGWALSITTTDPSCDNCPCVLTCPSNMVVPNTLDQCGAVVNYPAPTFTGLCGVVTSSPPSGSLFPIGTTTVTVTGTRQNGTTTVCTFTVTVNDAQPPAVTCPANVTQSNDAGQCSAVVAYTTPTPTDNCPGATVVCAPASGTTFAIGTTTVTCTATDASSNIGTCSFTVTVNDTQSPTITCPADVTRTNDAGQCGAVVTYTTPTPTDNCPGATVACQPASGTLFPVGTTTVTCTATDASANTGTCTFTVTVNDTQPPSITCPANATVPTAAGQCAALVAYTTPTPTDNCAGATVVCAPPSGSAFPKGTTTVTCTATDASSNTATCSFTVTVVDTEPPSIACPANASVLADTTQGNVPGAIVGYTTPAPTDNCPGATVVCAPASGSFFPTGTTTVTCTATDAAGNSAACSFTVTVTVPFSNCYVDDATGDTISIQADPASSLYRLWQYRVAATGQVLQGNAEYVANLPGRSLVAYDRDNATVRMDLTVNMSARTATATVTQLATNVRFVLRDRNTANDPPCF